MVDAVQKPVVLRLRVVDLNRNAVSENRLDDLGLRIRHGIQRLASSSTRVEYVEKNKRAFRGRALERHVIIGFPGNVRHRKASFLDFFSSKTNLIRFSVSAARLTAGSLLDLF